MKRFAIFMTIVAFLFVPMMTVRAQVQKPIQPTQKTYPKVEIPAAKPTGIQWSTPSKPYSGITDPVPSAIVKTTNFQVELAPGKAFEFEVPLYRGGTQVAAKVVPEGVGDLRPVQKKVSAPLSRSSNIDDAIRPLLEEQMRESQTKVLSMSLNVGNQAFQPIEDLSGKYKFLFIVGGQFSTYGTGKGVIKNLSNHILKGRVYASSTDHTGKENFERQQQQAAIQSAIDTARNPDMLWVLTQTLKRHLRGYPGGRSDYEERFSNTFSQLRVPNETLNAISSHLAVHENRIAQRVVNKSILQIRDAQPIKMEMIRPILKPKPGFQAKPKPEGEKYRIRLLGVMSHRCADDVGYEPGCDEEEPYILWTAFGPGYEAFGRTEDGRDVKKNDTWLYAQDVNVFGGGANRIQAIPVSSPLIFVYMVIEKDPGSPTRDQILGAASAGFSTVKAIYEGNWAEAVKEVAGFVYDVIGIFQMIAAKGDDIYPPYVSYFDVQTLLSLTTGGNPLPLDRALVASVGNYDHLSIRRADIYSDPINGRGLQWSVFYMILRGF